MKITDGGEKISYLYGHIKKIHIGNTIISTAFREEIDLLCMT